MNILLLSAYHAASHQRWTQALIKHLDSHNWTVLSLPARHFSWRLRGNSLTWGFGDYSQLQQNYDLIMATSMVDLSALRGFHPHLGTIPTIVYFHENQFAYPATEQQKNQLESQILSIYSALCADKILFNSEFNRHTFLTGCSALLKKLPDHVPDGLSKQLQGRSEIIPVPLEAECYTSSVRNNLQRTHKPLQIVWNHRWEYDKGPEGLLKTIDKLAARNLSFELHIMGQQFRHSPGIFQQIRQKYQQRISTWGYVENRQQYLQILAQADVILSTALHDFQGLALQEAITAACIPVAPDRLVYPEYLSKQFLYPSKPENIDQEAEDIVEHIMQVCGSLESVRRRLPAMKEFSWEHLGEKYLAVFERACSDKL